MSENTHSKAQAKYDREHTVMVTLKLNRDTDAELICWLREQPSKQGAIKRLIQQAVNAEKPRLFE